MNDKILEQLLSIRSGGKVNMCDCKAVFELSLEQGFSELANYIFENTAEYFNFILTGKET